MLNIAGGLLRISGGVIDRDFVDMLSADHREVLREGEFGDVRVSLEDRLIGKALEHSHGPHRDGVVRLFSFFAVNSARLSGLMLNGPRPSSSCTQHRPLEASKPATTPRWPLSSGLA